MMEGGINIFERAVDERLMVCVGAMCDFYQETDSEELGKKEMDREDEKNKTLN